MYKLLPALCLIFCFSAFSQKEDVFDPLKDGKKISFVAIPVINYNKSFGASIGAFASGFYHAQKNDTISPLSTSSLFGMGTTNKTWFAGQVNKFYLNQDKLRIKTFVGAGSINFQTFAEFPPFFDNIPIDGIIGTDDDGVFVDYITDLWAAYVEALFRIRDNVYLGGQLVYSHTFTEFDLPLSPTEQIDQFGFGISFELDSRDSQFSPRLGKHSEISTLTFLEDLGSTNSYTRINLTYNHYFPLQERNTILARFYSDISVGDVPFSGQNVVGRDDLRGYSSGKYRADQVYAVQTEYRKWFAERWGYVAFGGIATAVDSVGDMRFDSLLPAVGAGMRFLAIPKSKISIGLDVAVGKDDWGIYFRINEAFTR